MLRCFDAQLRVSIDNNNPPKVCIGLERACTVLVPDHKTFVGGEAIDGFGGVGVASSTYSSPPTCLGEGAGRPDGAGGWSSALRMGAQVAATSHAAFMRYARECTIVLSAVAGGRPLTAPIDLYGCWCWRS